MSGIEGVQGIRGKEVKGEGGRDKEEGDGYESISSGHFGEKNY